MRTERNKAVSSASAHSGSSGQETDLRGSVARLLEAFDPEPGRHGLQETPDRVVRMLGELLTPPDAKWKAFPAEGTGLVVVSQIPFVSMCEHHMLPFIGIAHVGYVPDKLMAGLSKFGRIVDHWSHRLQVQERLTDQVANDLCERLAPKGLAVVMEASHSCMAIRGVKKPGAITTTAALRGCLANEADARAEFYEHIRRAK